MRKPTLAQRSRPIELACVTALLLLAAGLRFYRPQDYPAGYHNDEVAISRAVESAVGGQFSIYFPQDTGHEAFYMYWSALFARALGETVFALRLSSAFLAMIGLCAVWVLARRMFGSLEAGVALATMSVTWWNVLLGRVALHVIAVVPTLTLATYFLWRGLFGNSKSVMFFVLSGILFALAFNSYTAASVTPLLMLVLVTYLALVRREAIRRQWRGLVVMAAVALILCAPLALYLVTHPGAKQLSYSAFDVDQPISDLMAGKLQLLVETISETFGMFGFIGDPLGYFDLPGRSLLEPVSAVLFWMGMVMVLYKAREPRCGLVLIGLIVMLTPGMLSQPAPNYAHTVGAMAFAFIILGVAVGVIWRRVKTKWGGQGARRAFAASLVLLLTLNIASTAYDFFVAWPAQAGTRWWMQTGLKEVSDALEADLRHDPVAVCVPSYLIDENIEWWRPAWSVYHYLSPRTEAFLRWYDCAEAMVIPAGGPPRFAFPDVTSLDQLQDLPVARWIGASHVWNATKSGQSLIVSANPMPAWSAEVPRSASDAPVAWPREAGRVESPALPVDFGRAVQLTAYDVSDGGVAAPGSSITVTTFWRVTAPLEPRLALFTHVLTGTKIVAQRDHLAVTSHRLQSDDVFEQVHVIELPDDIEEGWYELAVGLYSQDTGLRLQVFEGAQPVADRVLLRPLHVIAPTGRRGG